MSGGTSKSFCAGGDLEWMKRAATYTPEQNTADALALSGMLNKLSTLPCPTVALVHGIAFGGGVGVVSACDIAVATRDARFALSEARLGLIPATISPYVIRRTLSAFQLASGNPTRRSAARLQLIRRARVTQRSETTRGMVCHAICHCGNGECGDACV